MIQYRIATLDDLEQIARVHITCFPHTMWEFLGVELVRNFYEEYIRENPLFVVATDEQQIVGLCMGYKIPSNARKVFMQKNKKRLIKRILFGLLTFNRLVISKCWQNVKLQKKFEPVKAEGDLLSICVMDAYKGKGIAQQLVQHFEAELRKQNIADYTLSVYSNNQRAIAFYRKQGMQIVAHTTYTQILYKHF